MIIVSTTRHLIHVSFHFVYKMQFASLDLYKTLHIQFSSKGRVVGDNLILNILFFVMYIFQLFLGKFSQINLIVNVNIIYFDG